MSMWVLLWFRSLSAGKSFSLVNVWSAYGDRYRYPHLKYWQVMSRALIYWISHSFTAKMVSLVRWQGEQGAGNQLCVTIRASQRVIETRWTQGRRPNSLLVPQGCRWACVMPRHCAAWLRSGQSPEAAPGQCGEASRDGQAPSLPHPGTTGSRAGDSCARRARASWGKNNQRRLVFSVPYHKVRGSNWAMSLYPAICTNKRPHLDAK